MELFTMFLRSQLLKVPTTWNTTKNEIIKDLKSDHLKWFLMRNILN